MTKSHSRKGDHDHEKWLRMQRILGICVFVLSVLLCTIEMDFSLWLLRLCLIKRREMALCE